MIKARLTSADGRPTLILGLSEGNIQRLKKGEPILVEGNLLGIDAKICIMYGETEQHIAAEIAAHTNSGEPS